MYCATDSSKNLSYHLSLVFRPRNDKQLRMEQLTLAACKVKANLHGRPGEVDESPYSWPRDFFLFWICVYGVCHPDAQVPLILGKLRLLDPDLAHPRMAIIMDLRWYCHGSRVEGAIHLGKFLSHLHHHAEDLMLHPIWISGRLLSNSVETHLLRDPTGITISSELFEAATGHPSGWTR